MSRRGSSDAGALSFRIQAPIFAALGDGTRLRLIDKLGLGEARSISVLAADSGLTRQAITKHLRVLGRAGLVRNRRRGREVLYQLTPKPIDAARRHLEQVSAQWDQALARLKTFIEGS